MIYLQAMVTIRPCKLLKMIHVFIKLRQKYTLLIRLKHYFIEHL